MLAPRFIRTPDTAPLSRAAFMMLVVIGFSTAAVAQANPPVTFQQLRAQATATAPQAAMTSVRTPPTGSVDLSSAVVVAQQSYDQARAELDACTTGCTGDEIDQGANAADSAARKYFGARLALVAALAKAQDAAIAAGTSALVRTETELKSNTALETPLARDVDQLDKREAELAKQVRSATKDRSLNPTELGARLGQLHAQLAEADAALDADQVALQQYHAADQRQGEAVGAIQRDLSTRQAVRARLDLAQRQIGVAAGAAEATITAFRASASARRLAATPTPDLAAMSLAAGTDSAAPPAAAATAAPVSTAAISDVKKCTEGGGDPLVCLRNAFGAPGQGTGH